MFGDYDSEVTGFESCPETERSVNDKSSQTDDLRTSSQKTQTSSTSSVAIETAPDNALDLAHSHSYDAEKLSKFLKRILPHVEEELKNYESSGDELGFNQNDSDIDNFNNEGQKESAQPWTRKIIEPDFCKGKIISSLSWNSSSVLGLAYSERSHLGWCNHETVVGLYNTGKPQFDKDQPMEILKVFGCVRCIQFHNHIPSLLAGGLYSGEVIVWDLKQEEPTLINKKGSGDEVAHVDVITFLSWRENENGLWLVSAGKDGRIILWRVTITNLMYEVYQRFLILKQHLTLAAGLGEHLEIVHMDFTSSESLQFVAAGGGGTLFFCSLNTARALTAFPRYKDPILRNYKPRQGIITSVSCHVDLFASCGTDSEIHIFKYDQETPIMKIHASYNMLLGIHWISPKELMSWGDSKISLHRIHQPSKESMICAIEGQIAAVALKLSSTFEIKSHPDVQLSTVALTKFNFMQISTGHNRKLAVGNQDGSVLILSDWTSS